MKWPWHRKKSKLKGPADDLIHRCTSPLGEFKMSLVISLIAYEEIRLSNAQYVALLKRFHEHVAFWDIGLEIIRRELHAFSHVAHRPYSKTAALFDSMREKP